MEKGQTIHVELSARKPDDLYAMSINPRSAERADLEQEVIRAAKEWANHPETPKSLAEEESLYDAIMNLMFFEDEE